MPCVLCKTDGSVAFLVRVPPDEITKTCEEDEHQANREHACDHDIIEKHDFYLQPVLIFNGLHVTGRNAERN